MLKKGLILAGIFVILSACVITSPAELFVSTPTICVECVQATLCAEDQTGDCGIEIPTLVQDLSTATPMPEEPTEGPTPTEEGTLLPTSTGSPDEVETTEAADQIDPTAAAYMTLATFDTFTDEPTETVTPKPSKTLFPPTSTPEPPTETPTQTRTPGNWIYQPQTGSPKYIKNFAHQDKACGWSGIGGQIFGPGGVPQSDVVVVVTGEVKGLPIDLVGFSGSAVQYGPNGYEIEFPGGPATTSDDLNIQLLDLKGNELSDAIPFDTYSDCSKNLVILNFTMRP